MTDLEKEMLEVLEETLEYLTKGRIEKWAFMEMMGHIRDVIARASNPGYRGGKLAKNGKGERNGE